MDPMQYASPKISSFKSLIILLDFSVSRTSQTNFSHFNLFAIDSRSSLFLEIKTGL